MKHPFKSLALGALCLAAVLLMALLLPLSMDRVMAGTLNTVVSFTAPPTEPVPTDAVLRTPSPAATEAVAATLSPVPAPMQELPAPQHTQASAYPIMTELTPEPILAPLLAPVEEKTALLPVNWHLLMQSESTEALAFFDQAVSRWTELNAGFILPKEGLSLFRPEAGVLLVEEIQPLSLAEKKLILGLTDNLKSDSIYVPDKATLDHLRKLPVQSVLLHAGGGAAGLSLTQGHTLPIAAFARHAVSGASPLLSPQQYLELRDSMVAQARSEVFGEPDDSAAKSRGLVEQLMRGDEPWDLAIMRMEPYAAGADWSYHVAGHHLVCVDMKDGSSYTITTDLLSGQVIGMATEGAEPFLISYERLLSRVREATTEPPERIREAAWAFASQLAGELSGIPFTGDSGQWSLSMDHVYAPEWQKGYWAFNAMPVDAEARALDPRARTFDGYTLELDGDLSLRRWFMNFYGEGGLVTHFLPREATSSDQWLANMLASYPVARHRIHATAQNAAAHREGVARQALEQLSLKWKTLSLDKVEDVGIMILQPDSAAARLSVILRLLAEGEDGTRYQLTVEVGEDMQHFIFRTIQRQYDLPPGATELKG